MTGTIAFAALGVLALVGAYCILDYAWRAVVLYRSLQVPEDGRLPQVGSSRLPVVIDKAELRMGLQVVSRLLTVSHELPETWACVVCASNETKTYMMRAIDPLDDRFIVCRIHDDEGWRERIEKIRAVFDAEIDSVRAWRKQVGGSRAGAS